MASPGSLLGHYELVSLLGVGSAGEVWRATLRGPQGFERAVALKLLRGGPRDEDHRKALIREARLGAMLAHPNVLATLELGQTDDDVWYVAMELVHGETLATLVRLPLPPAAVLEVGVQTCAGLTHIHGLRVGGRRTVLVHRDIKPQNLLLDRSGLLKVADLGIAKWSGGEGFPAGTPGYMAPEQLDSTEDSRADLFSLGVVLYLLATRSMPFGRGAAGLAGVRHAGEKLADPSFLAPVEASIPGLARVVGRCLQPDPRDRWASAAELGQALRELRAVTGGPGLVDVLSARDPALAAQGVQHAL